MLTRFFSVAALCAALAPDACAVSFTTVADSSTVVPGRSETFDSFFTSGGYGPPQDGGDVAFVGRFSGGMGVYARIQGTLLRIADISTQIPGRAASFDEFSVFLSISQGRVLFSGTDKDPITGQAVYSGIFLWDGGQIRTVADTNTPVPGYQANFGSFHQLQISGEDIVFRSNFASGQGVFAESGGVLRLLFDRNTPEPGGESNFSQVFLCSQDGSNLAVLGRFFGGRTGYYTYDGAQLRKVVDSTMSVPGSEGGTFGSLNAHCAIRGSDIAFATAYGVYTNIGGQLISVADLTTTGSNGSPLFSSFTGSISVDADRKIVFVGNEASSGASVLYVAEGQVIRKITGPQSVRLDPRSFDQGRLAFHGFIGGREGIYIADDLDRAGTSFFNVRQWIRVAGSGGVQALLYNYSTSDLSVTSYTEAPTAFPSPMVREQWTGCFLYDYGTARFSQALFRMAHPLAD